MRISVMGDSISTFEGVNPDGYAVFYQGDLREKTGVMAPEDTWWHLIATHFGGTILSNASYSGSMTSGAGFPAARCIQRTKDLSAGGETPDVVLIFMGTNDYGWGSAHAQAAGRSSATPAAAHAELMAEEIAGLAADYALDEFQASYEEALSNIKSLYPNAVIWCGTLCPGRIAGVTQSHFAWNLRGVPMTEYNSAIARAATIHGAHVMDFAKAGFDYESLEGTHPTNLGMRQLAAMGIRSITEQGGIIPGIRTAKLDETLEKTLCESFETSVACTDACIGCEYAESTGNSWLCICNKLQ